MSLRTRIGNKGYGIYLSDLKKNEINKIKKDLTVKPFTIPGYGNGVEPFEIFLTSNKRIYVPKFYGIKHFGIPKKNKLKTPEKIDIKFSGEMRKNQLEPVQACLTAAKTTGGGILSLGCGSGKTCIALKLISELNVKALVVVNKDFLLEQWKERIRQFLPDAKVGLIKSKKIQVEQKDIVLGMLQSISMCDYDSKIFEGFGIVFYDEVHCIPSRVFSKALQKINTLYHFGLSATPTRTDKMEIVTKMYIGDIVYKVDYKKVKKNPKNVNVLKVLYSFKDNNFYKPIKNFRKKPDVVKMITNIIKCPKRKNLISLLINYFIEEKKRNILILSDRIKYLKDIEQCVKQYRKKDFKIGYYIGGMKERERKESETADLILASYSMAKEAMDIPILDTLLMATSKSNIQQSVGRIQRKVEYPLDKPPLVIDIHDNFSSFKNQSFRRDNFYHKFKYPVHKIAYDEKTITTDLDYFTQNYKVSTESSSSEEE